MIGAWRVRAALGGGGGGARALLGGLLGLHLAILLALAAALGPAYLGGHHFFLSALYALPFAGAGLACSLEWAKGRMRAPWVPAAAIALLVVVAVSQSVFRRPGRGTAIRPAAAWIREQAPGRPVLTNLAKLTYHAGAERVDLVGDYEATLRSARARGARFAAFYPDMVRERWPDFLARLTPDDLELARAFPEAPGSDAAHGLEVYRIKPQ